MQKLRKLSWNLLKEKNKSLMSLNNQLIKVSLKKILELLRAPKSKGLRQGLNLLKSQPNHSKLMMSLQKKLSRSLHSLVLLIFPNSEEIIVYLIKIYGL